MLADENWRLRAAACEILADRPGAATLAPLVGRAADIDWRVRAAAVAGLSKIHPLPNDLALRDKPLDDRQRALLAWLDAYDAAAPGATLKPELCELFADGSYLEFGRPLVERCLTCHVGYKQHPMADSGACASCYPSIYADWYGSAHAQSLSHLQLRTVRAEDRQVAWVSFGELRGMSCVECHAVFERAATNPAASPPATSSGPAASKPGCPSATGPAAAADESCARCHGEVDRQWRQWLAGRQPHRADWPPGQVDLDGSRDTRTCVDCHMTLVSTSPAELPHRDHRWRARRDAALLADGIALEIQPHADSAGATCVRFTLTNLAGHDYPTGTARRAIRLYAGPAGADDLPLLAAMSPRRPGWLWTDTQPPLAPGEQRHYDLMLPDSAQSVDYRLVFFRNTLDPNGFTNVITVGTVAVTPSASAEQAAAP